MKKRILSSAALLLAILLPAALLTGCGKKPKITVSDGPVNEPMTYTEVLSALNGAMSAYDRNSFRSEARSYASVYRQAGEEQVFAASYLQSFEGLFHNSGKTHTRKISSSYVQNEQSPAIVPLDSLTPFFDLYVKDMVCYYDYLDGSTRFKNPLSADYASKIGLYSIGSLKPSSVSGVRNGDVLGISLHFPEEDCVKSQSDFISTMELALFGGEVAQNFGSLAFSADIDSETGRFLSYTISFTGSAESDPTVSVRYVYTETFSDYGTKDEIVLPDLSLFESLLED